MEKKIPFTSRKEYTSFLEIKKGIPSSYLLIPDTNSLFVFLNELQQNGLSVYYGTLLSDTVGLKKTELLNDNLGCMGRILEDVHNDISNVGMIDDSLTQQVNFNRLTFRNIVNDEVYHVNDSKKILKIFLIYGYGMGSYFDDLFKTMLEFANQHKNEIELKIISLDPVSRLSIQ